MCWNRRRRPRARIPASAAKAARASLPALHYSVREPRNGKAPRHTVVLSHALGCDLTMWDSLANELAADCRVIAYDHRGHGSSDAPEAMYAMADLADDAARLLRELDTGPVVWVGLSMGGMVGQELALRHPALVRGLVLANTTSGYPEAARAVWEQRIATVRADGIEAIADAVMGRYFHDAFRARKPATVARFRRRLVTTDAVGYVGCCDAVGKVDTTRAAGADRRADAGDRGGTGSGDAGGDGAGAGGGDSGGAAGSDRRCVACECGGAAGGVCGAGDGVCGGALNAFRLR